MNEMKTYVKTLAFKKLILINYTLYIYQSFHFMNYDAVYVTNYVRRNRG